MQLPPLPGGDIGDGVERPPDTRKPGDVRRVKQVTVDADRLVSSLVGVVKDGVPGETRTATLAASNIELPTGKSYQLFPEAKGTAKMVQVATLSDPTDDLSKLGPSEGLAPKNVGSEDSGGDVGPVVRPSSALKQAIGSTTIDVMGSTASGVDLQAAVNDFVTQIGNANVALANSSSSANNTNAMTIRLVGVVATGIAQTTSPDNDIASVFNNGTVQSARNVLGADLVTWSTGVNRYQSACGVGGIPGRFAFFDYSVTAFESVCAQSQQGYSYALAHEIGHNLGAGHARANNSPSVQGTLAGSYGWGTTASNSRDLMSEQTGLCTCVRRLQYSNPAVNFLGLAVPSGTVSATNVLSITANAAAIASYRAARSVAACPCLFGALSSPVRIFDSRAPGIGAFASNQTRAVSVAPAFGVVPANAAAVLVNITATGATGSGFATAFPYPAALPATSTLNFNASQDRAATAVIKLDVAGVIQLNSVGGPTHLLVDILGYYGGDGAILWANTLANPSRAYDTRDGTIAPLGVLSPNSPRQFQITGVAGVPAGAGAVVANLTAISTGGAGFLNAGPSSSLSAGGPSVLNFPAGAAVPNVVTLPLSTSGGLWVQSSATAHLIIDVQGYYSGSGNRYVPITPVRLIGSQSIGTGAYALVQVSGISVPATATAVFINLTGNANNSGQAGFMSAFRAGITSVQANSPSNVNLPDNWAYANHALVGLTIGQARVFNFIGPALFYFDVEGYLV